MYLAGMWNIQGLMKDCNLERTRKKCWILHKVGELANSPYIVHPVDERSLQECVKTNLQIATSNC